MLLQRVTKRAVKLTRDAEFMMSIARWHAGMFGLHPNTIRSSCVSGPPQKRAPQPRPHLKLSQSTSFSFVCGVGYVQMACCIDAHPCQVPPSLHKGHGG
jgi:hypothetical protein